MLRPIRSNTLVFLAVLGGINAGAQEGRVEVARQTDTVQQREAIPGRASREQDQMVTASASGGQEFGVQELLREPEKVRSFRVFSQVAAFVTNNVALTRRHRESDAFLQATFGFGYSRELGRGFSLDADVQYAVFRYNHSRELDFGSFDAGVALNYHLERWGGIDLSVGYNFNALTSAGESDAFFKSHALVADVQKTFALGKRQALYTGATGQLSFSDPKYAQRNEVWGYVGYRLQATRKLSADLSYRYGYFQYEEQDRSDHNHSVAVNLNYRFADWVSAGASGYLGWNRSSEEIFNYDVANAGGSISLRVRF